MGHGVSRLERAHCGPVPGIGSEPGRLSGGSARQTQDNVHTISKARQGRSRQRFADKVVQHRPGPVASDPRTRSPCCRRGISRTGSKRATSLKAALGHRRESSLDLLVATRGQGVRAAGEGSGATLNGRTRVYLTQLETEPLSEGEEARAGAMARFLRASASSATAAVSLCSSGLMHVPPKPSLGGGLATFAVQVGRPRYNPYFLGGPRQKQGEPEDPKTGKDPKQEPSQKHRPRKKQGARAMTRASEPEPPRSASRLKQSKGLIEPHLLERSHTCIAPIRQSLGFRGYGCESTFDQIGQQTPLANFTKQGPKVWEQPVASDFPQPAKDR